MSFQSQFLTCIAQVAAQQKKNFEKKAKEEKLKQQMKFREEQMKQQKLVEQKMKEQRALALQKAQELMKQHSNQVMVISKSIY